VSLLQAFGIAGHDGLSKRGFILPYIMAVKTMVDYIEGLYFKTFTCQNWLLSRLFLSSKP